MAGTGRIDDGHFLVTPDIQAAALLCFVSHALFSLGDTKTEEVLKELDETDKRFRPIVEAVLSDVFRQVRDIAEDERRGG